MIVNGSGNQAFALNGADYVTIDGFTIINASEGVEALNTTVGITIRNNTIYGGEYGVFVRDGNTVTIENNRISNNFSGNGTGIWVRDSTTTTIRNNLVYNNGENGIFIRGGSSVIESNTLYLNQKQQMLFENGGTMTVRNNIVANGLDHGIEDAGSTVTSTYNLSWGNSGQNWSGMSAGTGDISVNPQFIDPDGADNLLGGANGADDQFHLDFSGPSPALDAGSTAASAIVLSDGSAMADRTSRTDGVLDGSSPDGATVNMGYHYAATVTSPPDLESDDGRLYYGENSFREPRLRTWDDSVSSWSAEGSALPAGSTIRWQISQVSPLLDNQELLAVLSDDGATTELDLLRWNGTDWTLEWRTTAIAQSNANKRGFDVAYERSSGDALVVYSDNTSTPVYRTRTAGTWSAEQALPAAPLTGVTHWIELTSRPGTDEIGLAYVDANHDLAVLVWTGSAWDVATSATLETAVKTNPVTLQVSNRAFDLAYESSSGDLLVAWARNGSFGFWYSTKAAGASTWTGASQVAAAPTNGVPHFLDLASEPGTDRIAAGAFDMGDGVERLGLATWNGGAWVNAGEYDSQIRNSNDGAPGDFQGGVAWVGTTGIAVCVYADDSADTLDWARWTAGGGWVIQSDAVVITKGFTESVRLVPFSGKDEVMAVLSGSGSGLFALTCDGTSWTATNGGAALELSLSSLTTVPFDLSLK